MRYKKSNQATNIAYKLELPIFFQKILQTHPPEIRIFVEKQNPLGMKYSSFFLWALCLWSLPLGAQNGIVFLDKNQNGFQDPDEKGLEGVTVSDGYSLTQTDRNGCFSLTPAQKAHFITVYTPSGYEHTTPFYQDIRVDRTGSWVFGLRKNPDTSGKFIHLSDIEERSYLDWMDDFKSYLHHHPVDFVAITGDICYAQGLQLNADHLNTDDTGIRMVYTLGNHDLIKGYTDREGKEYGEKLYEDAFGPCWYAFNSHGIHYIVTPMLTGDARPTYTTDELYHWLRADLESLPKGTPIILFNHGVLGNSEQLLLESEHEKIDLSQYNVLGYIYGHNHINYHYTNRNGTQLICSIAPNKGGNDHSPSSWRLFHTQDGKLTNELHYYPMPKHIAANAQVTEEEVLVSAVVYDGKSEVQEVSLLCDGEPIRMHPISQFLWQVQTRHTARRYQIRATFSDGEVRMEEVKQQKGLVWEKQLPAEGALGAPLLYKNSLLIPLVDDEMSERCGVLAVDKENGEHLWFFHSRGSVRNEMALSNGLLLVADVTSQLYALNPDNGSLVWKYKFRDDGLYPIHTQGIACHKGVVYVGQGAHLTALRVEDGTVLWQNRSGKSGGITDVSTYTVADGVLWVNAYWVGRYGFDAQTGELLWEKRDAENRYSTGTPICHNGKLYYTAYQSLIEADPRTGEETKRVKQGHIFNTRCRTLIENDLLIVGTSNHGITGYRMNDFSQVWNTTTMPALIYTSPYTKSYEMSVEGDLVPYRSHPNYGEHFIVGANDGYLYGLTFDKGGYVWRYEIGLPVLATPLLDGDTLYVLDLGGRLFKLDLTQL